MASEALLYASASAGMDLLGGLFGYLGSGQAAQMAESRARMVRMDADADVVRYEEQVAQFAAQQRVAYLKSGVTLEGSPLDVLDETARVAQENISAMRARGRAAEFDERAQGEAARAAGRSALVKGITGSAKTMMAGAYQHGKDKALAGENRKDLGMGADAGYTGPRGGSGGAGGRAALPGRQGYAAGWETP